MSLIKVEGQLNHAHAQVSWTYSRRHIFAIDQQLSPTQSWRIIKFFSKSFIFFVIIVEFSCKNRWVFFAKILEICYQDIQISYVLSLLLNLLGFSCPLKSITYSLSISQRPELADLEVFCLFALEFFEKLLEFFRFLEFILLEFF